MADFTNPKPLQSVCPVCEKAAEFCSCAYAGDSGAAPTGQWIKNLASFSGSAATPEPSGHPRAVPSDSNVGSIINDRYELLELLGQGGMGSVFRAKHLLLERQFALKILKCNADDSQESRTRFEREAKTAARLSHPCLVSVYDYGTTTAGEAFIVMDFIAGKSLAEIIATTGPLETRRAIHIFLQIVDGLAHAHANGVIHRDLKPSNVMIIMNEKGLDSVKVVDFGIAKIVGEQGDTTPALTKTGEVFGSPLYMSPEQCKGQKPDHRSDIYSLGCLMYECLNGQPVFTAENSLALIFKHVHEAPCIIESSSGQTLVPHWLNTVISKALAKAPDDRFQNMEELRQALDEGTPTMSVSPPPSTTKPATVDTSARIKVGIATLFVTAIGMFFYFASPRLRPPLPEKTTAPALIVPADMAPQPSKGDRSITAPQANAVPQQPKETVREGDREKHSGSVHPLAIKAKPSNKWPHKLESKLKSILRKL